MSNAVRHSFHTASDPTGIANIPAARVNVEAGPPGVEGRPVPILIGSAEGARAFDLFQPEPGDLPSASDVSTFAAEPTAASVVPIADGQFARQVARAFDVPQREATTFNLPLGGVAPTDREVAAARALIVGWIAACGIAAFAFLSQGPTLTPRPEDTAQQAPAVEAPSAVQPGDIRLDPAPAKLSPPRAKKSSRQDVPAAEPAKP
jgi:hypothetical protein